MKRSIHHRMRAAAWAVFAAGLPAAVHAGDGAYIGAEGGANWQNGQSLQQNGGNVGDLKFKTGWVGGVTGGYGFSNGLRPELELDYRRNDLKEAGNGFGSTGASGFENADTAMANLWYDFKAPTGFFSVVHPYLGGGAGGARVAARSPAIGGVQGGNAYDTVFAYQGGAGIGFDLTPHLTVSADYRYVQSNRGSFDVGAGAPVDARYRADSAMIGVRYSFGETPAPVQVAEAAPPPPPPPPAPPLDTDGDGVPDSIDKCPNTPHGFKVDADGCIIQQTLVVRSVDFEFNSARLTAPSRDTLDEVAAGLAGQGSLNVEVNGYTDSVGSAAYNLKLSQQRADAVRDYLVSKGVDGSRLAARGFGKDNPIAANDTDEGRALNRRVEFEVQNTPLDVKVVKGGASAASTEAAQRGAQPKALSRQRGGQ